MTEQWGGGPPAHRYQGPQQPYGPPPPYGYQGPHQQPFGSAPGADPYGPPPGRWAAPLPPPRPVGGLGTWTAGLLAVAASVQVVGGIVMLLPEAGAATSVVLGLSSLLTLACAVMVMVWLHHVRGNIEHLDPYQWAGRRRLSKGWAIGSWFVPVGFLWLPLQVVLDVWWGTAEPTQQRRRTPKLLVGWWACWLLSWCTGVRVTETVTTRNGVHLESHSVNVFPGANSVSALFATAAAVLLLLLVRRVTALQRSRLGA